MMPAWLRQLVAIQWRSRPMLVMLSASLLAGAVVASAASLVSLTKPTHEQELVSIFGGATALIVDQEWVVSGPGQALPVVNGTGDERLAPLWTGELSILLDGVPTTVDYLEADWPSVAVEGRLELARGSWPGRPGQCVVSTDVGDLSPVAGRWGLEVMGLVRPTGAGTGDAVLCATGTWQSWQLDPELAPLLEANLAGAGYFSGPEGSLEQLVRDEGWDTDVVAIGLRSRFGPGGPSSADLLTQQVPWLLIPLLAATGSGVLVGR